MNPPDQPAAAAPAPEANPAGDGDGAAGRSYRIAELPEHERPRERLMSRGAESLSEAELLAIILRSGPRGRSTLDLARDLLHQFGHDLGRLAAATPVELAKVKGIGPAQACELKATFALAARLAAHVAPQKRRLTSPPEVAAFMREYFRGKKQEELHALLLDTKNGVLHDEVVSVGLLDRSQAHAREVFRAAIQHSAAKLILAHNHPSGDPTPSAPDIQCSKDLVAAGKLVGIEVVDHVVLGSREAGRLTDYFSFREHQLL